MTALGSATFAAVTTMKVIATDLQPASGSLIDSGIVLNKGGGSTVVIPTTGITWPRTR